MSHPNFLKNFNSHKGKTFRISEIMVFISFERFQKLFSKKQTRLRDITIKTKFGYLKIVGYFPLLIKFQGLRVNT